MVDSPSTPTTVEKSFSDQSEMKSPTESAWSVESTQSIENLSVKVLEQTQRVAELEKKLMAQNRRSSDLQRQLYESRKMKEESDREVEKLSQELEDLTATLFDEANIKVKAANVETDKYRQRNLRLIETLKDRDQIIDLMKNEVGQLKDMIGTNTAGAEAFEKDLSLPQESQFEYPALTRYNGRSIYTPLYNQLRFDLSGFDLFRKAVKSTYFPFNVRESTFFKSLLTEEIEPVLRLDLSPGVRIYHRRSFINNLMDNKVTIEPLSASTEVWKNENSVKGHSRAASSKSTISSSTSSPRSPTSPEAVEDLKLFMYATKRPVATKEKCSLCAEEREAMYCARLYRLKIKGDYDYTLCVACANKVRCVVEVLKYFKGLQRSSDARVAFPWWCELARMRARLFYTKLGLWDEKEECGLVYGWQNEVIGRDPVGSSAEASVKASERSSVEEPKEEPKEVSKEEPKEEPKEESKVEPQTSKAESDLSKPEPEKAPLDPKAEPKITAKVSLDSTVGPTGTESENLSSVNTSDSEAFDDAQDDINGSRITLKDSSHLIPGLQPNQNGSKSVPVANSVD